MDKFLKTTALLSLMLLAAACKKDGTVDIVEPELPTQEIYEHGKPKGVPVTKTIGPEGGALANADGSVQLTIPAGAVAKATQFSIQPVENTMPGARGESFRLLPEGTTFSRPVTVRFSYANFSLEGTVPEALFLGYQDAEGRYWLVADTDLDTKTKTLTVQTTHFSDWQVFEYYRLSADKTVVKPGESATLKFQFLQIGDPDDLVAGSLLSVKGTWRNFSPRSGETATWSLYGEGKLIQSDWVATYQAPSTAPAQNPVQVSLKYSGFLLKHINNRLTNSSTQLILTKPITVADQSFITVTFKGKTITYRDGVGFSDNVIPVELSTGPNDENYFWIHLEGAGKGTYPFGPWYGQQAGKSMIRYELGDKQYASDKGWCRSKGNVELINAGSVIVEEYVKGQYMKGRFSGALDDMDNEDCVANGSPVSGTFVVRAN